MGEAALGPLMRRDGRPIGRAWVAAAAYAGLTVLMTWPLARTLTTDVASDLGDPLYYMWAIAWDCTRFQAILHGDFSAIATFFDANIFHPEPLGLVYSDHMVGQALQILPIYVLSGNLILCYNLLFLSTFVLTGLGTYLFVRELTGDARAAFIAGLLFAFAPYRLGHLPHLNLLSVQCAPLALYGLRRYFDTGRRRPLAGAAAVLVVQTLSSGYYLLYFMPFVAVYALWEIAARRVWRVGRVWLELASSAIFVAALTAPFLVPYVRLQDRLPRLRNPYEVSRYSADVYSYLTAPARLRVWRGLRVYPKREGDLFPGALPVALALVGIAAWVKRSAAAGRDAAGPAQASKREWLARGFLAVGVGYAVLATVVTYRHDVAIEIGPVSVHATDVTWLLKMCGGALATGIVLSRRARAVAARMARAPEAWALGLLGAAWWLSLGPLPATFGRPLDLFAPYALLFEYVPGYAGTRAPARFAMVVAFALAVLAGFGLRAIGGRRWGPAALVAVGVAFLAEVSVLPFPVNVVPPLSEVATPEPRVYPPAGAPRVYAAVRRLPARAVLVEFPFGHPEYDRRAMYYSTLHWRSLLNGYSGFYPPHYASLVPVLSDAPRRRDAAWTALLQRGVTHALVHEGAFLREEGQLVSMWLRASGATEIYRDGHDALFALPPSRPTD